MNLLGYFLLTPWTALGTAAAAVAVPVIIHLLNRRRYRIVPWAAMRFLLSAERKNSRRLRLEQMLLLAVRTLLLLLLVLAMASVMPWAEDFWHRLFPDSVVRAAAGMPRSHKVIVIDGSFSMAQHAGNGSCFDRARAVAEQIVGESASGDGFSVLLMASPPRRIVPGPSEDPRKVVTEIQGTRLPHGIADLAATLQAVDDLLRQSPAKFVQREVYFLTDLQRSTWLTRQTGVSTLLQQIQGRAQTYIVDVGQDVPGNLAVTDLGLGEAFASTGGYTPIRTVVHNFGAETREQVRVELWVGRAREKAEDPPLEMRIAAQLVERVARGPNVITFKHRFTAPGDYVVQVRLENDALELDDVRSAVVTVKDSVPVLLVNGKQASDPFDRAAEWLRLALNPFDDQPIPGNLPARPRVVNDTDFENVGLDLSPFDCIFLCDVARPSYSDVRRLEAHVRRGGGLVICLGGQSDLADYNERLYRGGKGLLPARLLGQQRAPDKVFFHFNIEEQAYQRPPLDVFGDNERASLTSVRFRQYVRSEPLATAARVLSFVPASAEPDGGAAATSGLPVGDAAVLDWQPLLNTREPAGEATSAGVGPARGRVLLYTSSANMDWTTWPASPSYVAFMQEALRLAVSGRLREQAAVVGDVIEEHLDASGGGLDAEILLPDRRKESTRTRTFEEASVLRWTDTDLSGIYRVTIGNDPREMPFAVNVPTAGAGQEGSESEPVRTDREQLQQTYAGWEVQVVAEPREIERYAVAGTAGDSVPRQMGPVIARWLLLAALVLVLAEVVLAWYFGHHSAAGVPGNEPARGRLLPVAVGTLAALVFVAVAGTLLHAVWTNDLLGFLPEATRRSMEQAAGIPAPAPGEGSRWRLEFAPYFWDAVSDPWLAGLLAVLGAVMIVAIYGREGVTASRPYKLLLAGLRVLLLLLMLGILLPQMQLWFERQGWPDVVLLIDDSQSMSTADRYRDPEIRDAADRLAALEGLSEPQRLQLAKLVVSRGDGDWLSTLLIERKVKVHLYHCSSRASRVGSATSADQLDELRKGIVELDAPAVNDSSQLGSAVRQVLNDFRGSSLAAVVMLTDGVNTDGEDLVRASRYAAQVGVPLYFVGLGESLEARDLELHDLQVEDAVYVNDRVVFEARLTGHGYNDLAVPVTLREKGKDTVLARKVVRVDPQGKPVKVRLVHQPTEPGEKVYVLDVPTQADETRTDNNTLERSVFVHEAKLVKVLYVEGYARYEYRYVKTLLERESARSRTNKTMDLRVLLLDADAEYATQDRSALAEFPTRSELKQYDAVILGDVDPRSRPEMREFLANLASFVKDDGGGLLVVAGERHSPHAFRNTPLADILPIEMTLDRQPDDPPQGRPVGFRPRLTALGRLHPIFRFSPDEQESADIWAGLREVYWWSEGYKLKPAAEVLAVHPDVQGEGRGGSEGHPLIVQQFVGAGRCMFFGIHETWRWRWREDELRFNQFWIQTVRHLGRSRLGRVELRLDRQTPYNRGEPIKVTVRFPDDASAPPKGTKVEVAIERRPARAVAAADVERQAVTLSPVDDTGRTYEWLQTHTPEGDYRFWLSEPTVAGPRPSAECRVLAPPGEMEQLRMNRSDMERAAETSRGKFYTLAEAGRVPSELPTGLRVTLNAPGPPWLLWNQPAVLVLVLLLLTAEWVLRKRKWLL